MRNGSGFPRLNFDVLSVVIEHVEERSDISSLMKTCKTLYHSSIPHLLDPGRGKIILYLGPQVSSLCSFMLAEPHGTLRVRSLRQLHTEYSFQTGPVELAYDFARIVQRSVNLEELTFEGITLEGLLAVGGQLIFHVLKNLKAHTRLRHFVTGNIDNRGLKLLTAIEVHSITHLEVSRLPLSMPWDSVSPVPILRRFSSTLTHLALSNFNLDNMESLQCPLVRSLELTLYDPPTFHTAEIMHAFPKVNIFVLDREMGDASDIQDVLRARNNPPQSLLGDHWNNLRYAEGKPMELYILRLPCHVHELHINYDLEYGDKDHIIQVLEDCTPIVVELSLGDEACITGNGIEFLTSLIDNLDLFHSTHLRLRIVFVGSPMDFKGGYLDQLVQALSRPSALQYVWFDMVSESQLHEWTTRTAPAGIRPETVQECLELTDAEQSALSIAKRLPSLKRIGFDIFKSEKSRGFWDVVRFSDPSGSCDSVSLMKLDNLEDNDWTRQARFWDSIMEVVVT